MTSRGGEARAARARGDPRFSNRGRGDDPNRGRGRGGTRGSNARGRGDEPVRGKGRGKGRGKSAQRQDDSPTPPPSADYGETTDPKDVTGPVLEQVDPALVGAWSINNDNRMAIIFDAVNPVRQFQRGVPYNEKARPENAFAKYDPDPKEDPYVTEDEGDEDLRPYEPIFVL